MARSGSPSEAKLWNSTWARLTEKDWASGGGGNFRLDRGALLSLHAVGDATHALLRGDGGAVAGSYEGRNCRVHPEPGPTHDETQVRGRDRSAGWHGSGCHPPRCA